jgi:hypothetical protein
MRGEAPIKTGAHPVPLYETDPYTWTQEQARALREHRAVALDWENLAEEVGDLAAGHAESLQSYCQVLIEHLLKLAHAPVRQREDNRGFWINSARNARIKIDELLEANPGLKARTDALFARAWRLGRNDALGKLDLEDGSIPQICPWTFDRAIDDKFWPTPNESSALSRRAKPRNRKG